MGTFRIVAAILLGLVIIGGAIYLRSTQDTAPDEVQIADTAAIRQYINPVDKDNNGVPDWQDKFRPTPAIVISSSTEEVYAAPETITGQFGLQFFQNFIRTGGELSPEAEAQFLQGQIDPLVAAAAKDELITSSALSFTFDESPETLRRYGNTIAAIFLANFVRGDELRDIDLALRENDPVHLASVRAAKTGFEKMLTEFTAVSVPPSLAREHLVLLNTTNAMRSDMAAFSRLLEDPIVSMIRLERYYEDNEAFFTSITNLYDTLGDAGVLFTSEDIADQLISYN